jgi:hypothetical protein
MFDIAPSLVSIETGHWRFCLSFISNSQHKFICGKKSFTALEYFGSHRPGDVVGSYINGEEKDEEKTEKIKDFFNNYSKHPRYGRLVVLYLCFT